MNKKEIAEIIEENKDRLSSMEIAMLIADAINDEWFYQRKDTWEAVIG